MTVWWLLGALGICLAVWSIESTRRILYPERRHILPPDPLPAYTVHPIVAPDGSRFDVWVLETTTPRGRLLLFHGYDANRYQVLDPVVLARRCHQPLLAIQDGEDRRVVPLLGREFYRCWAGPKERWFEEQIAHVGMFARHPQEYCGRVAEFFDRTLRT